ncbi:PH domain-containing protein [Bifidobacterium oedipodis]|uniref:Bacterial PH domain-containing protein n=1 Tax=Bifidobacterium oedipodis TaxID=2675322 RepID=A0A7Y0HSF5_9BIFI|nr:PH domain-containing protein [Bifidobacterium sp. DSM 109957]NMM93543.1 Bacterial PH domain-containing protein [Bifidobacterium sp. DSM 109957]
MDGNQNWHRFHPASILANITQQIIATVALAGLIVAVTRNLLTGHVSNNAQLWAPLAIAAFCALLMLGGPVLTWLTTDYHIGDDSVQLRERLFGITTRTIYYRNIHAINATSPLHLRPFSLVNLTISSAGTSEPSITLQAVPASLQLELEQRRERFCSAANHTTAHETDCPADQVNTRIVQPAPTPTSDQQTTSQSVSQQTGQPAFRASLRDIALYAITDIGMVVALLALLGIMQHFEDLLPNHVVRMAYGQVRHMFAIVFAHGTPAIAAAAVAVMALLMLISIGMNLIRYYGFALWRHGDDLVVTRGLVTRQTTTMPVSRIQTVVIKQSLLRRPFHLCTVEVGLSATLAGEDNADDTTASTTILPVVSERDVYRILSAILPDWQLRSPGNTLTITGRGLLRYYLFAPACFTACMIVLSAVLNVAIAPIRATWSAWITHLSIADISGWAIGILIVEAILIVLGVLNLWWRAIKNHCEGYDLVDARHIACTGATFWTRFTLFTTRARAQSAIRRTARWRERRGIERMDMPLFVRGGMDELRFTFLRRPDADRLERWFRG